MVELKNLRRVEKDAGCKEEEKCLEGTITCAFMDEFDTEVEIIAQLTNGYNDKVRQAIERMEKLAEMILKRCYS